jgi:hypothetical protein
MALAALNLDWSSNRMNGFREQARATWPQGQSSHAPSARFMGPEASSSRAPCGASIYVVCAAVHSAASRIGEPNCARVGRGIVAGESSTGHGLQCFGVGVERRHVLKRYTSAPRCAEGSSGKPRLPRGRAGGCTQENRGCVPAEVPERAAK